MAASMTSLRVLHLEDDARDAELVRHALATAEYSPQITTCNDRPGFEQELLTGEFDVVFCDYSVPRCDPLAVIAFARANRPSTPLIVISGELGDERAVDCLRSGATDYVLKDNLQRLSAVVARALKEATERTAHPQRDWTAALDVVLDQAIELTLAELAFVGVVDAQNRLVRLTARGRPIEAPAGEIILRNPQTAEGEPAAFDFDRAVLRAIATAQPMTLRTRNPSHSRLLDDAVFDTVPLTSLYVAPLHSDGGTTSVLVLANFPNDTMFVLDLGRFHAGRRFDSPNLTSLTHQLAAIVERYLGRRREATLRAERAAAEGTAQQAFKILDATKDSVFIIDPDTLAFTYVNGGTLKLLGYKHEEIMSLSPLAIFPHDQVKRFATLIGPMSRKRDSQVVRFSTPYRTNSGGQIPMEVSLQYVKPETGSPAFIAIGRDMTEWQGTLAELRNTAQKLTAANAQIESARDQLARRIEERTAELANTERLLRDMTNGLPGAVFQAEWTDATHVRFNFVSAGFETITGLPKETIMQHPDRLLERIVDEDRIRFLESLAGSTNLGREYAIEFRMRHMNGTTIWTNSRASATRSDGRTLWNGYWSDITAERAAKIELEEARRSALSASHAKSAFLATMSHEIRTPMNAVVGLIDLLMRDSLTAEQRRMISTMRTSTFALLHIIDDILDFSKIEAGRLDTENKPVSILECVELVADMFALKATEKHIELSLVIDPRLTTPLLADGTRVRQVLINLIGNAVKFTDTTGDRRGVVAIHARLSDEALGDAAASLIVDVRDNGIGLEYSQMEAIFEPFIQAESSTTRPYGGTGLGLSISRRLAELMGGRITVASKPKQGSTFTLALPARSVSENDEMKPLKGHRVALIGQKVSKDNYYAAWLRHWGCAVSTYNLPEADRAMEGSPEAFVVDTTTPNATLQLGTDTVQRLATLAPLIIVSDLPLPDNGDRVGNAVVTRRNPFFPTALLGCVMSAVGRVASETVRLHDLVERTAPTRELAEQEGTLILVAEDNPANQEVIARQLAMLGYAVDMADDGLMALELWREHRYGLILTDIHMPRSDGYDLAIAIRREQQFHVPIIALTADAVRGTVDRAHAAGISDYVTKPVELKTLAQKIRQWLPYRADTSEAPPTTPIPSPLANDGIDFNELSKFVGDDPAVHARILQSFLRHTPSSLDAMDTAMSSGDSGGMRSASHKLKSSARSIGALKLGEVCESLEHAADDADWTAIERLFSAMRPLYWAVEKRIGDHLRRH